MTAQLHYIYDPLCGWCYGAEPLVHAAAGVEGLDLELHGGGLWPQPTRLPAEMRRYIRHADARVGAISGQPYGAPYLEGLLDDPELTLHSRPTIAAVLAAGAIDPAKALPMLSGIQHAHYERGLHVIRPDVLIAIAAECGLDRDAFAAALDRVDADAHIAETRRLMDRVGAPGLPTMLLTIDGEWHAVPHNRFSGDGAGFAAWLRKQLSAKRRATSAS